MMWELIAANRRKSLALFAGMAIILCGLGYTIGHVVHPEGGGYLGLFGAIAIWVILAAGTVFGGESLVLRMSHAHEVTPDIHPQLFNIVEEMKIAAGLEAMPKVYIIDEKAPNAFATGMRPETSAIAVTAGLLSKLNRDELQGVVAHEMSHILNRDVQFMTVASIMLGSIVIMSEVFLRGMWFTGGGSSRRYRSKGSGGSPANAALVVVAIILAILGPIFARLLYLAISRKREYLADASAVRLTRYPEGLAGALEKISGSTIELGSANKVTAPMYIINPLRAAGSGGWGSTHPPAAERIAILRAMTQGADLTTYQRAFSSVRGKPTMVMPASGLRQDERVKIREPHPDVLKQMSQKEQTRDVMDLMRAVNGYAFLICACGLKIKVPPDMQEPSVACPRCKRDNAIPRAQTSDLAEVAAVVGAMVGASAAADDNRIPVAQPARTTDGAESHLEYRRRTDGWETFACACGHSLQLSPAFSSHHVTCRKCDRITHIT